VACCTGCSASCPLDKFIELTRANIPTDWRAECNSSTTAFSLLFDSPVYTGKLASD